MQKLLLLWQYLVKTFLRTVKLAPPVWLKFWESFQLEQIIIGLTAELLNQVEIMPTVLDRTPWFCSDNLFKIIWPQFLGEIVKI